MRGAFIGWIFGDVRMNCPECEREIHGVACRCGYMVPPPPKVKHEYVTPTPQPYKQKPLENSYRARWFAERKAEYEPPKLFDDLKSKFRCVGIETEDLYKRLTGGELGRKVREPGSDDDYRFDEFIEPAGTQI